MCNTYSGSPQLSITFAGPGRHCLPFQPNLCPSKQSGTEYNVCSHVLPKSVEAQPTKEMAGLIFVALRYSYP